MSAKLQHLIRTVYQLQLLEYEGNMRNTPSGHWHPLPPRACETRADVMGAVERIQANIRNLPHVEGCRNLVHEFNVLSETELVQELLAWANNAIQPDDMAWVHMPDKPHWELVYVEARPSHMVARSIVTENVLYEILDTGDSLNGNIKFKARGNRPWSVFKYDRSRNWEVAAQAIRDEHGDLFLAQPPLHPRN